MSERLSRGWRYWATLILLVLASVAATGMILFGAVRFLDQADREHQRVECIRVQVQVQARANADMAAVVLDQARSASDRAGAVAGWRDEQARVAERIGRC